MLPSHSEDLSEVNKTEDILRKAYYEKCEQVKKLEGWLKYLNKTCSMPVNNLTIEIGSYIKAMEVGK